ncbi:MAG: RNA polymerase sigma-54 factor [Planctomycetota bacterium]|nr:MAG: RNA polymerase sigma-54 factor [Planctomycetota bacterium]
MSGMRFEQGQQMRLGQQMKLAPRVIQSMEILQMALPELEERVEQELESNATLETFEATADGPIKSDDDSDERDLTVGEGDAAEDFARLDAMESSYSEAFENEYSATRAPRERAAGGSRLAGERDAKLDAMANTAARGPSLAEQLAEQWDLADVDEETQRLGRLILEHLDADGYLRTGLDAIADRAPEGPSRPDAARLEEALLVMQAVLDPPGVLARNPRECLLIQIDAIEDAEGATETLRDARRLIAEHLDDLSHNRLPAVAEATGLPMERIRAAVEWMHRLSLAPGRALVRESAPIVIPDAIVEYDEEEDRYVAHLTDGRLPSLRINPSYNTMAKDRGVDKKTRDFIKTNLSNAHWLIDALHQRRQTLLRVLNVVLTAQREFFDYGPASLKPLPMTQVADQLGVHVATVSRAVSGKHIQTPRGVHPLRMFFTGGTQTRTGEEVSWEAVRQALREIIDAEDKAKPLSDDALVAELKKRGIDIARRTVAKYRAQLGIPSTRLRKRH